MKYGEVIKRYRERVAKGERIKLTTADQIALIQQFIDDLKQLKTETEIQERCKREIALLEEGYPQKTIAKTRLNQYRNAIQEAIFEGKLKLTNTNSKKYTYDKKKGTEKTGEIGEAHHHYGWLYMCYADEIYLKFNTKATHSQQKA